MLPASSRVGPPSTNTSAGTTSIDPLLTADELALRAAVTAFRRRLPST